MHDLGDAKQCIDKSQLIYETPMLTNVEAMFGFKNIKLFLKLENMQNNGRNMTIIIANFDQSDYTHLL